MSDALVCGENLRRFKYYHNHTFRTHCVHLILHIKPANIDTIDTVLFIFRSFFLLLLLNISIGLTEIACFICILCAMLFLMQNQALFPFGN